MGPSTLTSLCVGCVITGSSRYLVDDLIEPPPELVGDSLMDRAAFTFNNHLFPLSAVAFVEDLGAGADGWDSAGEMMESEPNHGQLKHFIGSKQDRARHRRFFCLTLCNHPCGIQRCVTRTALVSKNESHDEILILPIGK